MSTTASDTSGLDIRGASKRFGATVALDDVNLRVTSGEIRALVGANGSGKSTLIKALAGYHVLDQGRVFVKGHELNLSRLGDEAKSHGLRFVHQDLALVPTLSVAENLSLERGYPRGSFGRINKKEQIRWAEERLAAVDISVDPISPIDALGPVERTLVAITRALDHVDPRDNVLLLDEPSARLPPDDTDHLIETLLRLRDKGLPIVYVTHRLEEVYRLAQTVTILRDGVEVYEGSVDSLPMDQLSSLLIGPRGSRSRANTAGHVEARSDRRTVLSIEGLSSARLRNINCTVFEGEIVGVTGLIGSGRSELGRVVYGLQEYDEGTMTICGQPAGFPMSTAVSSSTVGYTPQERDDGLLAGMSVADNIVITALDEARQWFGLSKRLMAKEADRIVTDLRVVPRDAQARIDWLSGGNRQKVMLGKWLRLDLSLVILDEPTQSIDVGVKAELMSIIRANALEDGLAVLWLESDVQEIVKYADRILVMRDGRIETEFASPFDTGDVLSSVYGEAAAGSEL